VAEDQKGAAAKSAWIVFFDESAVSLIPPVRRTWSPRGTTPILRHRFGWKKASMAAALGYHPGGTKARLCFHLQEASYNTDALIGVLDQLGAFYAGQRVVLIWDGLSAHWSTRMRAYLDSQHDWLTAKRLPAYAPELNPVQYLWANLKDVELANLPPTTLAEVADAANRQSNGSVTAKTWLSASWPTPASPSTTSRQPNPRNSKIAGRLCWVDSGLATGCAETAAQGR
jgi:transposase